MAHLPAIKEEMLAEKALKALVEALENSKPGELPKYAAGALAVFVAGEHSKRYGAELASQSAYAALTRLLTSVHQPTQQHALWALAELLYSQALEGHQTSNLVPQLKGCVPSKQGDSCRQPICSFA